MKTNTIMNKIKTFLPEASIFILLMMQFVIMLPNEIHGWNSAWYALNYSYGSGSRLLIGSILSLFYGDYLTTKCAYAFVVISYLVLILLISICLGHTIRAIAGRETTLSIGFLTLLAMYLLGPGSFSFLWTTENMGRFDLYLVIFILIAVLVYARCENIYINCAASLVCSLLAISVHQVFFFLYFPVIFAMLLMQVYKAKLDRRSVIASLITCVLIGCAFLYFQFFNHINADSLDSLVATLQARTELPINEVALNYEYFAGGIRASFNDLVMNELGERIRYGVVTIALLAPVWVIYGVFWKNVLRSCETTFEKFKYILTLFSLLLYIPAFMLTIDWGRWFGAFLIATMLMVVVFAIKKDAPVIFALKKLGEEVQKHPVLYVIAVVYLASLGRFECTLLPAAPQFFAHLYELLHIL